MIIFRLYFLLDDVYYYLSFIILFSGLKLLTEFILKSIALRNDQIYFIIFKYASNSDQINNLIITPLKSMNILKPNPNG